MALRVLLADESSTIKKVMQLALQDFAVEVKAVQSGVDVAAVAKQFKPDIIFADILLHKKNGYEVSQDLKQDPYLKSLPIVLMWSSFMEMDERSFRHAGADDRLEKPFDVETLRNLVMKHVPKTKSNPISEFLTFPAAISTPFIEEEKSRASNPPPPPPIAATAAPKSVATPPRTAEAQTMTPPVIEPPAMPPLPEVGEPVESRGWNMDSFEDIQQFAQKEISTDEDSFSHFEITNIEGAVNSSPTQMDDDEDEFAMAGVREITAKSIPVPHEEAKYSVKSTNAAPESPRSFDEDVTGDLNISLELGEEPETFKVASLSADLSLEESSASHQFAKGFGRHISSGVEQGPALTEPDTDPIISPAPKDLEKMLRAQSREVIEEIVRKIVPEIAEDLIRKELQRLLAESEAPKSL